ncbi:AAA family ATPase [Limnohabitans planktonicus]|uniref:AAA family ATPase n=1 Tax=Limnohabitans planktonicus TaxID=540060 RepID=UPI000B28BE5B|nr:AAA family ATPase [Limnohabitans planktonicus]
MAYTDIHIDPLSVLVGTNASGKSNALNALLLFNRVASGSMLTSALKGDGTQAALRGGVEWAARCWSSKTPWSLKPSCTHLYWRINP